MTGRRYGGGRSSVVNQKILVRRLESCKHKYSTLEEIVDNLRTNYPDYKRIKQQPFTRVVQQTLDSLESSQKQRTKKIKRSSPFAFDYDNEEVEPNGTSSRKKQSRIDHHEERLQQIEELYIKRRRMDNNRPSTSSELESNSSSSSSDEEEDGAVSTSSDAIYGEPVEPKFDLMKSMLRATYIESKNPKTKLEEKNLEMEVATNKADKIDLKNGDGIEERLVAGMKNAAKSSVSHGADSVEVKGKEGPRFRDLGGMGQVLDELKLEVMVPLYQPHLLQKLGVGPITGILLHGPPGCGKTKLAHAIANEAGVPFYKISATEVVSGVSGASEENIRELFSKAYRTAPSIVFIDEIDAIASKRENLQREMERRIVTQLMTCMDSSNFDSSDSIPKYVLVIGATNRPDAVDSALRRPGRFDREIALGVPDENDRLEILSVLTRDLTLEGSFDILKIAKATPGFVGADLVALTKSAGNLAVKRIMYRRKLELSRDSVDEEHADDWLRQELLPEEMEKLSITMADFEEAAKSVQPSLRREGFSSIPNVKWEDVGGLDLLRQEFERGIMRRIKFSEDCVAFGVDLDMGFLLYGPPGCGKTLIAKAVANEAGANFIHIKGPELLNKYVGESEQAVRTLFSRARACSPCILFFDEVDALTTVRGKEGGWVVERLLNQLLIELDGADKRQGVFVIGATNRPEVMDPAVLRPGRLGKLLYVPLPSPDERGLILKALARKKPIDPSVDLSAIGRMEVLENFSGSDLSALMNEAAISALEEKWQSSESHAAGTPRTIKTTHFEQAMKKISASITEKQKEYYQVMSERFRATRL